MSEWIYYFWGFSCAVLVHLTFCCLCVCLFFHTQSFLLFFFCTRFGLKLRPIACCSQTWIKSSSVAARPGLLSRMLCWMTTKAPLQQYKKTLFSTTISNLLYRLISKTLVKLQPVTWSHREHPLVQAWSLTVVTIEPACFRWSDSEDSEWF